MPSQSIGEVEVFVIDLTEVSSDDRLIDEPARERSRTLSSSSRDAFIARRTAVAQTSIQVTGHAPTWRCPTCAQSDHGKPTVPGYLISTSSWESTLVIAIAPDSAGSGLGIDIAPRNAPPDIEAIAELLYTASEQQRVEPMDVWVGKEALGKAWGVGLADDQINVEGGRLDTFASAHCLMRLDLATSNLGDLVGAVALLP